MLPLRISGTIGIPGALEHIFGKRFVADMHQLQYDYTIIEVDKDAKALFYLNFSL